MAADPDPTAPDFPAPRYVRANVPPADDASVAAVRAEYGPTTTVHALRCQCGGTSFSLRLHDDGSSPPWSPMHATCTACGRSIVAFDETVTGYDGLVVFKDQEAPPANLTVTCPSCGHGAFGVVLGFQYSDLDDLVEVLDELGDDHGYEDLFGWFIGYPTCVACGHRWEVVSIECM